MIDGAMQGLVKRGRALGVALSALNLIMYSIANMSGWTFVPSARVEAAQQAELAEGPRLAPVDQGASDPSFSDFRKQLRRAARERDLAALESVLDPDVRVSFGPPERGLAAFRSVWHPEIDSMFWTELQAVLALGATGGDGRFWVPYVYSLWPMQFDPFHYAAVIDDDVPLRRQPTEEAPAAMRLSYHIVRVLDADYQKQWQRIAVPGNGDGYVPSSVLHSPNDLRIEFRKVDGHWRITTIIAGD